MQEPEPITVRARLAFRIFAWMLTLFPLVIATGLFMHALAFTPLIPEEPALVMLFLPVALLLATAIWIGRWALFHTTARIEIDRDGLTMRSATASDALRWDQVEAIRLQSSSGSEAQLYGHGHRVTVPSGAAIPLPVTQQVQDWITFKLNDCDLDYGYVHFWGP